MKSKKVLAQLAALSLLFGVAGAGTAWADTSNEVQISGEKITAGENLVTQDSTTKTKYTMADKTVAGLSIDGEATLTATNVNFVDADKETREVVVDGGSVLSIKGGSVSVAGMNAFGADGGSTITTDGTKITSSVFANNSAVTLKDSTTSSFALYAGNEWSEGVQNQTVATGLGVGTLTIDGGTASAKNVLVQNKGTITVKNGAVLDVTGDTTDNDEDVIAATGLEKGGVITVRAWGPNLSTAEKSNNDEINELSKASEFVAEKATVKANAISVAGNKYVPEDAGKEESTDKYVNWAKFTASGSTIEAKDISFGVYSIADFSDKTQIKADTITVEGYYKSSEEQKKANFTAENSVIHAGTIAFGNSGYGDIIDSQVTADKVTLSGGDAGAHLDFNGGTATIDEVTVSGMSAVYFENMTTTTKKITVDKSSVLQVWGGGTFQADTADVKGYLEFYNDVKATLGEVTASGDGATIMMYVSSTKENENLSGSDVTISKLVLKDQAEVDLSAGKLTANSIDAADGTKIEIKDQITEGQDKKKLGSGTLSTKSSQIYKNAASETATDSGDVTNKAIKFTGGKLELTDDVFTLDYAKAAKAAMEKTTDYGSTELSMTGKAVDEKGEEIKKVSIEDAALIGNLKNSTLTSEHNVLIGSTKTDSATNDTIDGVKVETKIAGTIGGKNLELTAGEGDATVGVVITNAKALTLGGDEEGNLITVVKDGEAQDKAVKVIVGTESAVTTGADVKGTFTVGNSTGTANTLKGEVLVNTGSAFNVNGDTTITKTVTSKGGTIAVNGDLEVKEGVTLNQGTINVASGASLNTNTLKVDGTAALTGAATVTDTLTVAKSQVLSVGDKNTAGQLVVKKLSGEGMIFLDPDWVDGKGIEAASGEAVEDVSEAISNALVAGRNSKISLGTEGFDEIDTAFAKTGKTWSKDGITAAAYVATPVTLGTTGSLTVDGSKDAAPTATNGAVTFAANSMLLVDGAAVNGDKAAISGVKSTAIDADSKLYIDNAKKGETYKILAGEGLSAQWDAENVLSSNALLAFTADTDIKAADDEVADQAAETTENTYLNYTSIVQSAKDVYGDDVIAPDVIDKATAGDSALNDFIMDKAVQSGVNSTKAAQVSALNSAMELSELAGAARGAYTTAGLVNDAVADHMSIVHEYTHDKDVWAKYIHNKDDVDGLSIAGKDVSYKNKYNGIVVGADLYHNEKATVGLALTYGDGDITGSTLSAYTKNDAKYYGATIYGGIHNGDTAFLGDISYLHSKNDITQTNSGETITGTEKSKAFSIGVRAERSLKAGEGQFVPYAGLRYMHLSNGSYTDSLGLSHDGGDMNLWLLPVGVKYSMDAKNGSWTLRPIAEIGYVWNMGDRDARETVSFDGTSNSFGYDVTDNGSFLGHLGFEAEKGNTTFGIGYQYQKGDSVKSNRWSASVNYRF